MKEAVLVDPASESEAMVLSPKRGKTLPQTES